MTALSTSPGPATTGAEPLYRRVLAADFDLLPAPIRAMHDLGHAMTAEGFASVERGETIASRVIATLIGFPAASARVPVRVDFAAHGASEIWRRTFGANSFASTHREGPSQRLVLEQFGPFTFAVALGASDERLAFTPVRWWLLGLPLPSALIPHGNSYEHVVDGRFAFHVELRVPIVGLLVRYRGTLSPPFSPSDS